MNGYDSLIFLAPMLFALWVMHTDIFNSSQGDES